MPTLNLDGMKIEFHGDIDVADCYKVGPVYYQKPATLDMLRSAFFQGGSPWRNRRSWRNSQQPGVSIRTGNWYNDQYNDTASKYWKSWDQILEFGKSYMVGDTMSMDEYIKRHRSPLTGWQKIAYDLAKANPSATLELANSANTWNVSAIGPDMVQFSLPYHMEGGERHYISKNGRSKILVNVD